MSWQYSHSNKRKVSIFTTERPRPWPIGQYCRFATAVEFWYLRLHCDKLSVKSNWSTLNCWGFFNLLRDILGQMNRVLKKCTVVVRVVKWSSTASFVQYNKVSSFLYLFDSILLFLLLYLPVLYIAICNERGDIKCFKAFISASFITLYLDLFLQPSRDDCLL